MYATAPVKRGLPRSRIRAPPRHERASPHPSRKCRSRGRKPLTRRRIDAAKCWRLCQPHPRFRHAGFRFASTLRGVAGVATYRFTRSCYTSSRRGGCRIPCGSPRAPSYQAQRPQSVFPQPAATRDGLARPALNHRCGITRHRLRDNIRTAAAEGLGAAAHADKQPQSVFP